MTGQNRDAGLQPERTSLAWQRSALALGIGSAFGIRIFAEAWGIWAVAAGCIGLGLAGLVFVVSRDRYRLWQGKGPGFGAGHGVESQRGAGQRVVTSADGKLILLLALSVAGAGTAGLWLVLS